MTIAPLPPAGPAPTGVTPQSAPVVDAAAIATAAEPPLPVITQSDAVLALDVAVQDAAGRQGGMAGLMADIEVALQAPGLPPPVRAAATLALGLALPLDPPPTAADLRQALALSGLFLEAHMATPDAAAFGPDMKAALLSLDQALQAWLGAAPARAAATTPPAPPYRGGPVRGQPPASPSVASDASIEVIGGRLMQETGRALARQLLLQAASLPDLPRPLDPRANGPQWQFELPLLTPQGAAVAQFEISRDGRRAEAGDEADPPVWRARFSLHLEPMGPIHARIALSGERVRVSLWAENPQTTDQLTAQSADLSKALMEADLVAQVSVAPGAPSGPPPPAGRLVDRAL